MYWQSLSNKEVQHSSFAFLTELLRDKDAEQEHFAHPGRPRQNLHDLKMLRGTHCTVLLRATLVWRISRRTEIYRQAEAHRWWIKKKLLILHKYIFYRLNCITNTLLSGFRAIWLPPCSLGNSLSKTNSSYFQTQLCSYGKHNFPHVLSRLSKQECFFHCFIVFQA